jgi:hypothetical protein
VPGLEVVGVELLLVVQDDRQPALVELLWVRLQVSRREERGGLEAQAVERVLAGEAAGDREAEAGVGEVVLFEHFGGGTRQRLVLVLERDEQRLTRVAQAAEVLLEAEDLAAIRAHRREHPGRVQQAGVADGDGRGLLVDNRAVEPDDGHEGILGRCAGPPGL